MELIMDRPRSIAAVYAYESDLVNLGILAGTVAAGVALYASGRRKSGAARTLVCPACGENVAGDSSFCHSCGAMLKERGRRLQQLL